MNEQNEPKLLRNRAKCLVCGDVLESTDRHDFKTCSCGALSVDGGLDYIRRGFKSKDAYEELSEYKEQRMDETKIIDQWTGAELKPGNPAECRCASRPNIRTYDSCHTM